MFFSPPRPAPLAELALKRALLGALILALPAAGPSQAASLRFYGHGVDDIDRVKIQIDDPAQSSDPGPPVDVGATDFTIEFFVKARVTENSAPAITCGANYDWILGNIVLDRDRFNQGRAFGISIAGGLVTFGLKNDTSQTYTICGTTDVRDNQWHHVAVQRRRSDGLMRLFVDGSLEGVADGPDGDISYPDDGVPNSLCGPSGTDPCTDSDPFLVLGAEKHDAVGPFPSYSGWLDELRVSDTLRYTGSSLTVPTAPFATDGDTVGLYHFDELPSGDCTGTVLDASGASGGPSNGMCSFGGSSPAGPVYSQETPFAPPPPPPVPALSAWGGALLVLVLAAGSLRRLKRQTGP